MVRPYDDSSWHLDKRIPIALIISLLAQFGFGIWWVAGISNRVTYLELQTERGINVPVEIVQIKEQLRGIERTIGRLEVTLDRRVEEPTLKGNLPQ